VTLAARVDEQLARPVLVFGSLPPEGRDLDLLVRPEEEVALVRWLRDEGFVERGGEWVRFRGCNVESLDVVPIDAWGLPADAIRRLFDEARPIDGFRRLVRPAPRHVIVMLAQRVAEGNGRLVGKKAARLERALAEDVDAWAGAEAEAPSWRASRALAAFRAAHTTGRRLSRAERAAALAEGPYAAGRSVRRARARAWREVVRRRRRKPLVISFSGLDGAGKSSQVTALLATLDRLGFDAERRWVRLEWTTLWESPWLGALGWPARSGLRLVSRLRRVGRSAPVGGAAERLEPAVLRERSNLISHVWVTIVALAHAAAQRRAATADVKRDRMVICDRYTLDAAVQLRFRYGESHGYRFQIGLLTRLSPRPVRAYLIDVPAEVAYARRAEQYSLGELARQAELYRAEAERLGVRRLDGSRPREELSEEIARDVWRGLH
jgi:thymidylate kinase